METETRYRGMVLAVLGLVLLQGAARGAPSPVLEDGEPLAVILHFARAFEKKDFATLRGILTEDAAILRTSLSRGAAPRTHRFSARDWADEAERNHAALRDLKLEILGSASSRLSPDAAVVHLRYRFTGKAGKTPFVSDGIDTYSLVRLQGRWRVCQYAYIERLELQPGGGQS